MALVTNVLKSKARESFSFFLPLVMLTQVFSRARKEGPAGSAVMLHGS